MRNYDIYLMETEVARHYFGQESKLVHLYLDLQKNSDNRTVIQKQVDYITRPIPVLALQKTLKKALEHNKECRLCEGRYQLVHSSSDAELTIDQSKLRLKARGTYEAETIFFEVLRKFDPCFIAMDIENFRYGWLSPIKQVTLL